MAEPIVNIAGPDYDVYRVEISPGFFWELWGPKVKLPNWWFRFWQRVLLGWKWTRTGEVRKWIG